MQFAHGIINRSKLDGDLKAYYERKVEHAKPIQIVSKGGCCC